MPPSTLYPSLARKRLSTLTLYNQTNPLTPTRSDIYMIAFQEIVELTAGQILQTDPAKKRMWEKFIMDTFAMRKGGKDSDYMLFRGDQLVGTALIIVVKKHLAPHIRNIESATKKVSSDLAFLLLPPPCPFRFFPTPYTRALELTTANE